MATKKFKKLPKDSQRAAFAQMDKDGTRNDRGKSNGGGMAIKTLKRGGGKIPHIKTADQETTLNRSLFNYERGSDSDKGRMMQGLLKGEIHAESDLRNLPKSGRKFDELRIAKKQTEFLSAARAFRIITGKKSKK